MSFESKPATRQGIIPLLALWGGTGGGKTESALRLARGLAGPAGRVGIIDTEGRRSSYYVGRIPGGFNAIPFEPPYNPERYIEALDELEKTADVGVIDSASHCWEGPDGILDLHEQALDRMLKDKADDWKERERLNWPAWREPKMRWKVLRNRILACRIPLIICFRGDEKTRMERVDGRNTVVTDKTTTPIFDKKFIFETHVAMEVFQKDGKGGFVRFPMPYAKTSHADIRRLLPEAETQQLTVEHGAALAQWCASPGKSQTASAPANQRNALLKHLRDVTVSVHGFKPGMLPADWNADRKNRLEQWLYDELVMADNEELAEVSEQRLSEMIANAQNKLDVPTP